MWRSSHRQEASRRTSQSLLRRSFFTGPMEPNENFRPFFKAIPAKTGKVNFAKNELVPTPQSPSLRSKKNFDQKQLSYCHGGYFCIWLPYPRSQLSLDRLTPNYLCLKGTWQGLTWPILAEIKKYLGVLPVPRPNTSFSKGTFFRNFCIFFLVFNLAEIFFVDSTGGYLKFVHLFCRNSFCKCLKKNHLPAIYLYSGTQPFFRVFAL